MSRYVYKIVDYVVGTESGGSGTDKLTLTLEINPQQPSRVYVTKVKLVRYKYTAHTASQLSEWPFALYMLLTPDPDVTAEELNLGYNHQNPPSSGVTVIPTVNTYSMKKSGSTYVSVPRTNAMTILNYIVLASHCNGQENQVITVEADGVTAVLETDLTDTSLLFDLKPSYSNIDAFSNLYVKLNQYSVRSSGSDWYGWYPIVVGGDAVKLKDLFMNKQVVYHSNGGSFISGSTTYTAVKGYDASLVIRNRPEISPHTVTVNFNVPSDVTTPSSIAYSDVFTKWTGNADGSGISLSPGDSISTELINNLDLYAQWRRPTFGDLPSPARAGYEFTGWSRTVGGPVVDKNTEITETTNFTLYSNWVSSGTYIIHRMENGSWVGKSIAQIGIWKFNQANGRVWEPVVQIHRFINNRWEDIT